MFLQGRGGNAGRGDGQAGPGRQRQAACAPPPLSPPTPIKSVGKPDATSLAPTPSLPTPTRGQTHSGGARDMGSKTYRRARPMWRALWPSSKPSCWPPCGQAKSGAVINRTLDPAQTTTHNVVEIFNKPRAAMSTVNFSVPDDVKKPSTPPLPGKTKVPVIADLMREAVQRAQARQQHVSAIDRILARRAHAPSVTEAQFPGRPRRRPRMIWWWMPASPSNGLPTATGPPARPHRARHALLLASRDGAVDFYQPPRILAEVAAVLAASRPHRSPKRARPVRHEPHLGCTHRGRSTRHCTGHTAQPPPV